MQRDELAGWLRLALTPGVGDGTSRKLLSAFGMPEGIFGQSRTALTQVVTAAQADALRAIPPGLSEQIDRTWQWLQAPDAGPDRQNGGLVTRRLVTLGDTNYPSALLESCDPPLMLYVTGAEHLDLSHIERAIAIVGSRNPTPQGEANARSFARAFASMDLCVVSGLAMGIDAAAHQGALDAFENDRRDNAPAATVAVVGTGLDRVYPARHRELAHRIASNGLLISEFALGTPPLAPNFPKRNRVIAGLTRGTLVVEAALASGSLITARLAMEQGREVFAIPGSIHSPQSRGCHALIRQGAKLVETARDVLEELRWPEVSGAAAPGAIGAQTGERDPAKDPVLEALGHDPVGLDALVARTGLGAADLQARLLELELDGRAARLPGGLFQRLVHA